MSNIKEGGYNSLSQLFSWSMAPILRDFVVVTVVFRTRPQSILQAMISMRKSIHGFPLLSYMGMGLLLAALRALRAAGAPLKINTIYPTYILT